MGAPRNTFNSRNPLQLALSPLQLAMQGVRKLTKKEKTKKSSGRKPRK
jgi:hypothetical protein